MYTAFCLMLTISPRWSATSALAYQIEQLGTLWVLQSFVVTLWQIIDRILNSYTFAVFGSAAR